MLHKHQSHNTSSLWTYCTLCVGVAAARTHPPDSRWRYTAAHVAGQTHRRAAFRYFSSTPHFDLQTPLFLNQKITAKQTNYKVVCCFVCVSSSVSQNPNLASSRFRNGFYGAQFIDVLVRNQPVPFFSL